MSRGARIVVALTLAFLAAACSAAEDRSAPPGPPSGPPSGEAIRGTTPDPPTASDPPAPSGWRLVGTGGTIVDLSYAYGFGPGALAAGEDGGRPLLVRLEDGVASMTTISLPDDWTALRTVESDGETVALTATADDGSTRLLTTDSGFYGRYLDDVPSGPGGTTSQRLEPILDGEEDYRAVGVVRTGGGRWEVRAWEALRRWQAIGRGPSLRLTRPPGRASLLADSQEVMVMVGGDVARDRGDARPQLWWIASTLTGRERWLRLPLSPRPDVLTDVSCWEVGCWVLGARRGRPVVYDFDTGAGTAIGVPHTRLDRAGPVVLMARQPIGGTPLVLATASVGGNRLWVGRRGSPAWTGIEAPEGELTEALVVRRQAYLLIDGQVWFRRLG